MLCVAAAVTAIVGVLVRVGFFNKKKLMRESGPTGGAGGVKGP